MSPEELRALLVEQGALIVRAYRIKYDADQLLQEAVVPLLTNEATRAAVDLSPEEQHAAFVESCHLAGIPVSHPALRRLRERFQRDEQEARLIAQSRNADWN